MSDTRRILEIAELTVARSGAAIPQLDRFSLTLDAGESVIVLGEAGSGKETLIRVLGGFAERTDQISGTIRFGNAEARPAAKRARAPIRIAYLHFMPTSARRGLLELCKWQAVHGFCG